MGRRKILTSDTVPAEDLNVPAGAPDDDPMGELVAQETRTLADAIARLGGMSPVARLYRRTLKEPKFVYVDTVPLESLDEEAIGREYGGGDYRVTFLNEKGQVITHKVIKLDPRIKGVRDTGEAPKQDTNANDALTTAVNRLAERSEAPGAPTGFIEMMQLQFQAQQQSSQQMFQMLMANNQANVAMLTEAMKSRPQPDTKSPLNDLLTLFMPVVVKMIEKKSSPLENIELIVAIKDLFQNDEGKEDMLEKVIKYVGPAAAALLQGRMGPGPEQTAVAAPSTAPGAPPPDQNAPNAQMQAFLGLLLNAARKKSDVCTYADIIDDGLDDVTYERLMDTLEKDDWFDVLFGKIQPFHEHRDWLSGLRQEMLARAESGPEAADTLPPDEKA